MRLNAVFVILKTVDFAGVFNWRFYYAGIMHVPQQSIERTKSVTMSLTENGILQFFDSMEKTWLRIETRDVDDEPKIVFHPISLKEFKSILLRFSSYSLPAIACLLAEMCWFWLQKRFRLVAGRLLSIVTSKIRQIFIE